MAWNLDAFILRRLRALGFSKARRFRTSLIVPSRSTFFFRRRKARSTGSPFFSLISVLKEIHPQIIRFTAVFRISGAVKLTGLIDLSTAIFRRFMTESL